MTPNKWQFLISELRARGMTLAAIAQECGFASRGHVHDVLTGRQPRVMWDTGNALIQTHRRVMRRSRK